MSYKPACLNAMAALLVGGLALTAITIPAALAAGTTERVSVNTKEQQGNGTSLNPTISGNGRYVVFDSSSTNFGPQGHTLFLRDRVAGTTTAIDYDSQGKPFPEGGIVGFVSRNARVVVFEATERGGPSGTSLYARDLATGATELVSIDENGQRVTSVRTTDTSANGRYVLFESFSTNSEGGQTSKSLLRDLQKDTTTLLPGGDDISGDARFVVYSKARRTDAPTDVFVLDRQSGQTRRVTGPKDGPATSGSSGGVISDDGTLVAFASDATDLVPGDTNGLRDVFVRNLATGATERVSVGQGGAEANGNSYNPRLSADGRYVVFYSAASNLAAGGSNGLYGIFFYDRRTKTTMRVDVNNAGALANDEASASDISADGSTVVFQSFATNLVTNDTNGQSDIFVRVGR